jgi:subtilisin family serine protease
MRALAPENGATVAPVPRRYLQVRRPVQKRKKPAASVAAAVPPASGATWHLQKTRTDEARRVSGFVEPAQIKVAVLDTGIDQAHPLLKSRIAKYLNSYSNLSVVSGSSDIVGHGTHVAGTIAAMFDKVTGVSGMCSCKLYMMKIFDDEAEYFPQYGVYLYGVEPVMYLRALAECLDLGVQVINLSIGGPAAPSVQEANLINELLSSGCVIVAAMGNDRQIGSPISYPAAHPGIIAVGATDLADHVASFSNRGPHISLSAPGKAIWSTMPTYPGRTGFQADLSSGIKEGKPIARDTTFGDEDGTSMASPQVAAAAAMYLAKSPQSTPVEVRTALTDTAAKTPEMGSKTFHEDYGYGRLDVAALLA